MKILLLLALAQAPLEPWTGTLAEGLEETERLAASGATAEALALTERLLEPTSAARWREEATARPGWKRTLVEAAGPVLEAFGLASLSDAERATIHHARGVLLAQSAEGPRLAAVEAFERARALAGPGELRLDSTYDAGWTWLVEGEALRAKIPEISGAPPPSAAPAAAPGGPPEPDPLALARTAYLQARERFVDRIRLSASDADTRANLELAQRRLRELEAIEKKREEEKKEQEQQQKDEKEKEQQDPNQQDQQEQEDKKDSEPKPDEPEKPDEQKPDEEPPKDEEKKPDEPKDPAKEPKPKPAKEELLTREEVMRLLDILKDREEEGKKLQEQLRAARRVAVKKDW